jgi:hypothetical protein
MNRRSLIKSLATFLAGLLLPPIRFVQAKVKPVWATGKVHWLHLDPKEAVANPAEYSPEAGAVAHKVCQLTRTARAPRIDIMEFASYRDELFPEPKDPAIPVGPLAPEQPIEPFDVDLS